MGNFKDQEIWENVDNLVMEYHLWAKEGSSVIQLLKMIKDFGFRITHFHENRKLKWGILHATKSY